METRKRNVSLESVLVMIFLIIFAVASCSMIVQGSKSYNKILLNKENEENARIAFSYINMRIKQNDVKGKIYIKKQCVDNQDALVIEHSDDEEGYITYIYFDNNKLLECYTDKETKPTVELSSEVVSISNLILNIENNNEISVEIPFKINEKTIMVKNLISLGTSTQEVIK